MKPQLIISQDPGEHNKNLETTVVRLNRDGQYKDLSTIVVVPTIAQVPVRVVMSWWGLMAPPNNRLIRIAAVGMEVGEAYSRTIQAILDHPQLNDYKYFLALESDNVPPCDGLTRLLSRMEEHQELSAISGLYFTKGPGGVAQIWGNPYEAPINFRPQKPSLDGSLVECCGTGMGFTLFRMSMFADKRLRKPWFKTTASAEEGCATQDLYFWNDARKYGYRCAVDCSVKVGHYAANEDIVW